MPLADVGLYLIAIAVVHGVLDLAGTRPIRWIQEAVLRAKAGQWEEQTQCVRCYAKGFPHRKLSLRTFMALNRRTDDRLWTILTRRRFSHVNVAWQCVDN
jgi:hypothetical protein